MSSMVELQVRSVHYERISSRYLLITAAFFQISNLERGLCLLGRITHLARWGKVPDDQILLLQTTGHKTRRLGPCGRRGIKATSLEDSKIMRRFPTPDARQLAAKLHVRQRERRSRGMECSQPGFSSCLCNLDKIGRTPVE